MAVLLLHRPNIARLRAGVDQDAPPGTYGQRRDAGGGNPRPRHQERREDGRADRAENLLTNAPHTLEQVIADEWRRPYPRERAAYPSLAVREHKVWPTVGRIDSAFGDRNLVCVCPPMAAYE